MTQVRAKAEFEKARYEFERARERSEEANVPLSPEDYNLLEQRAHNASRMLYVLELKGRG